MRSCPLTSPVPITYDKKADTYCTKVADDDFKTYSEAAVACSTIPECTCVYDYLCDGEDNFELCGTSAKSPLKGSCVYTKTLGAPSRLCVLVESVRACVPCLPACQSACLPACPPCLLVCVPVSRMRHGARSRTTPDFYACAILLRPMALHSWYDIDVAPVPCLRISIIIAQSAMPVLCNCASVPSPLAVDALANCCIASLPHSHP